MRGSGEDHSKSIVCGNHHIFGIAPIRIPSGGAIVSEDIFFTLDAIFAGSTGREDPGDTDRSFTNFGPQGNYSDYLMTENYRQVWWWRATFYFVAFGMANGTMGYVDQYFSRSRDRHVKLARLKGLILRQYWLALVNTIAFMMAIMDQLLIVRSSLVAEAIVINQCGRIKGGGSLVVLL